MRHVGDRYYECVLQRLLRSKQVRARTKELFHVATIKKQPMWGAKRGTKSEDAREEERKIAPNNLTSASAVAKAILFPFYCTVYGRIEARPHCKD